MGSISLIKSMELVKPFEKDGKYNAKVKLISYSDEKKPIRGSDRLINLPIQIIGVNLNSDRGYGSSSFIVRGATFNEQVTPNISGVATFEMGSRKPSSVQTRYMGKTVGNSNGNTVKPVIPSDVINNMKKYKEPEAPKATANAYYSRNTNRIVNQIENNKKEKSTSKRQAEARKEFAKFLRSNNYQPVDLGSGLKSKFVFGPAGTKSVGKDKYVNSQGKPEYKVVSSNEWIENYINTHDSKRITDSLIRYVKEYF